MPAIVALGAISTTMARDELLKPTLHVEVLLKAPATDHKAKRQARSVAS